MKIKNLAVFAPALLVGTLFLTLFGGMAYDLSNQESEISQEKYEKVKEFVKESEEAKSIAKRCFDLWGHINNRQYDEILRKYNSTKKVKELGL